MKPIFDCEVLGGGGGVDGGGGGDNDGGDGGCYDVCCWR